MPHKDRAERLDYLRRWKIKNRPSPTPEAQDDSRLPPRGVMVFSADEAQVQCHCCGRWFGSLNTHLKAHDLDARTYKELYGLPRTASMWPPALREKQRQAALDRDQGTIGRTNLPRSQGRPAGLEQRLGVRIVASRDRQGLYMRGGEKIHAS